ncbi:unnamed protein product, partial [Iphiclides podalirius]
MVADDARPTDPLAHLPSDSGTAFGSARSFGTTPRRPHRPREGVQNVGEEGDPRPYPSSLLSRYGRL